MNGDSEEEDDDDEGVCWDHADVNDEGVDIGQQIGNDLVTFWKREIDKFAKDMTLSHLLLPGTFTSDQRKELHDYADIPSLSSVRGSCILQTHSYLAVYASDNYYLRSST